MRITPYNCDLSAMGDQICKAVHDMASHCDSNQWTQAASELGKIEALAGALARSARLTSDILWEENESFNGRR